MWQFWLIVAGVCLIAETITVGFLIFWFSIGALITMIVSFFIDNIVIQSAVFILSSGILIFATKPLVKKITKSNSNVKTNVYSLVDSIGLVTDDIDPVKSTGQIKVAGETWSAISKNGSTIEKGSKVKILEIKGVKAVVETVEENTSIKA